MSILSKPSRLPLALGPWLMLLWSLWAGWAQAMSTDDALQTLTGRDFKAKGEAIAVLAASGDAKVLPLFAAIEGGDLYYHKQSLQLVIRQAEGFVALDDGAPVSGKSSDFKRVVVNNALRRQLTQAGAQLQLSAADVDVRLAAIKALLGKVDTALLPQLQQRLDMEPNADVQRALKGGISLHQLRQGTDSERLAAARQLAELPNPQVLEALRKASQQDESKPVRLAAGMAARELEQQQSFYSGLETLYFGLSLGSVLVLAGIGLAITFGVMGVINMAHGELMMLGAYTTFVMQKLLPGQPGLALLLSIPAAFAVSGLVGIVIERCVIRFLYGRPLETLLATFGISLLLQQAVRSIFSPLNQSVSMPSWMSGTWVWNDFFALTLNRMAIILFSLLVFAALMWLLRRSTLGLEVRAVSQNRAMARNMGVRSARVNALTFGLGSGVAGVAGVALSQLTNVGPNLGQGYIIDAFMVVVFGGVGNLWGTLVAGLSLGVANKLLEPYAGAVLAKILILVAIILFIQKRPRGLFPQRGRAVEG